MDFFTRIAEHTPQLNKNDNELLSYCIRNHTEIANLKVTELADRVFSSPASVVRFCKKLGFSGYSDFKASLRMDLFEPEETPREGKVKSTSNRRVKQFLKPCAYKRSEQRKL